MATVSFSHNYIGSLTIDNGIDDARWAYGLNTATFPTYGGEVVQILSVYIDDLTLIGTCATYAQMEAIYSYFTSFFSIATQGKNPNPQQGGTSYNLTPMYFSYPERNWYFKIYPTGAPGFTYDLELTAPVWQLTAHVIDDSPDLRIIKDGIKGAAVASLSQGTDISSLDSLSITGNISPQSGDPNTDPFQTFDSGLQAQQQAITKYSDYYSSLIPSYMQGDFAAITGAVGSAPNFGQTNNQPKGSTSTVPGTPNPGKTQPGAGHR